MPWRQTPSRFDPGKVEALAPRATGSLVTRGTLQGLVHVRHEGLRREFERWLESAEQAGLDEESIRAVISTTLREAFARRVA